MSGSYAGTEEPAVPKYLVDAVMALGCLAFQGALRQLVLRFGDASRAALNGSAGLPERVLVAQLLEEVYARPDGLAPFLRSLELWEDNTPAMRRLKVAAAAWEVDLLDNDEWDELFRLLEMVQLSDLHRRYSEFLQSLGREVAPAHCTEPWTVFLHAATLNCRPGDPLPCFQVLQQLLALGAPGEVQTDLLEWARTHQPTGARTSVHGTSAGGPGKEAGGAWSPSDYLIIRLRPLLAPDTAADTLLSHWWRLHPGEQRRGDDRRITLRQAETEVRTLLTRAETQWAYALRSELALEFVLPRDWLHLSVERWAKAPFEGAAGLLGEDHQVVIRSMERLGRRDLHGSWGRRWEAFSTGRAGRVHWFPEDGRPHLLSDPPPAVVVLSEPAGGGTSHPAGRTDGQLDELSEALRVGVPVILWDRREGMDERFRTALRALIDHNDPRDLPTVVRRLRTASDSRDAEGHFVVGRNVALLWDDPDRMPVLTTSPAVGGAEGEGEGA